jgi:ribose transport system ATP-binding protein
MSVSEDEILQLKGLTKSFAGFRVLSSVDLALRRGEVHALIGQNGSGKSTLIKIVSGYHAPDSGGMVIRGQSVPLPIKPGEANRLGLRFLHQDVGVVRTLTVLENLRVGRYQATRFGRLDWREERRRARKSLEALGLAIDPDAVVKDVPAAERAIIGFARAIQDMDHERGEVLILDEPTAFLPSPSVEKVFAVIREIAKRGSSVVFVSHRLDEVMRISDRVTILRDGRRVDTVVTARTSQRRLVADMLGRELDVLYPQRTVAQGRPRILAVDNLTGRVASGVSFVAHQGEILGLTGLLGMGHDEIPYLLFGAQRARSGEVVLDGRRLDGLSPTGAMRAGMAFLPSDRQRQSGIPKATLLENVSMTSLHRCKLSFGARREVERSSVLSVLERFDVRPPDPERMLATLSGGNQQKALLGKWLQTSPCLLLLHEPTQGVDIGSRKQILQIIAEAASAGAAVMIASAEYEELANLCHRVLVFRHGRVVQELSADHLTEARIAEQCFLA